MDINAINRVVESNPNRLLEHFCHNQEVNVLQCINRLTSGCNFDADNTVSELDEAVFSFISHKAHLIYMKSASKWSLLNEERDQHRKDEEYSVTPPFLSFLNTSVKDKKAHIMRIMKPGDVVIGEITNVCNRGLIVNLLCFDEPKVGEMESLKITGFCPFNSTLKHGGGKNVFQDDFQNGDTIRAVVTEIDPQRDIVNLSLFSTNPSLVLGLISLDELPSYFRRNKKLDGRSYDEMLCSGKGFNNPACVPNLLKVMNLNLCEGTRSSLLNTVFTVNIPKSEFAANLRKSQNKKLSMQSVVEGVKHFKSNNMNDAVLCFNQALSFDSSNTEALVARGALLANRNNFIAAIRDLRCALDFQPSHSNARKYLSQVYYAVGKVCESKNQYADALENYQFAAKYSDDAPEIQQKILSLKEKANVPIKLMYGPALPTTAVRRNSREGKRKISSSSTTSSTSYSSSDDNSDTSDSDSSSSDSSTSLSESNSSSSSSVSDSNSGVWIEARQINSPSTKKSTNNSNTTECSANNTINAYNEGNKHSEIKRKNMTQARAKHSRSKEKIGKKNKENNSEKTVHSLYTKHCKRTKRSLYAIDGTVTNERTKLRQKYPVSREKHSQLKCDRDGRWERSQNDRRHNFYRGRFYVSSHRRSSKEFKDEKRRPESKKKNKSEVNASEESDIEEFYEKLKAKHREKNTKNIEKI